MKLQACKFQRVSSIKKARDQGKKLKSEFRDTWETGVAVLKNFNDGSVEYIIDENGKKVSYKQMHDWMLINGLALCAIDTKYVAV